ncbi:hypothetical protein EMIHUDRAFT_219015 [Emiliania huxleyi CCMP1516]|uniref:AP2/ERF domain-containing protein n=2 Tax=Emiliania huxleyi TaxID=2903 RepID=A0A0D3I5K0_EMIH1|nr:hypothetical protein EMIHUDRAFT_219015 [Emiliania huxleyi CCMP1516]EOD06535.1 hypothetical protein EMIHUDRAFT_219015 [Emiliania huxleyi CCMP1516]|eukprot:XP_005758964.1 hypothetical protein EMIHUDRAFT_219015 [Emiliania huxleyi CCMP1516]
MHSLSLSRLACGCDVHLTAEQARALAKKEGLSLVERKNATGFAGVIESTSRLHPFAVLDTRPTTDGSIDGSIGKAKKKILGKFVTAEHAALAYARHVAEVGVRARGGWRAGSGRKRAADASTGAEAWWKYRSEERGRIEAMSAEAAGEAAVKEGANRVSTAINPSGYKGVIMRASTAEGGPTAYSAHWQPCASDAKRLGKKGLRFGVWSCPEHAALGPLAREEASGAATSSWNLQCLADVAGCKAPDGGAGTARRVE